MNSRPTWEVEAMLPIEKNMPLPSKQGNRSVLSSGIFTKPGAPPLKLTVGDPCGSTDASQNISIWPMKPQSLGDSASCTMTCNSAAASAVVSKRCCSASDFSV